MRASPVLVFLACALPAQAPAEGAPQPVRVLVGGPPELRARLAELARAELGPAAQISDAGTGDLAAPVAGPTVLFAVEELALRRMANADLLEDMKAGADLAPAFRDPGGLFALTLVSPITLAFDTRIWNVQTAPPSWEELPFATAGDASVGAVDPALDPVPMAAWIAMQWEQGHGEDRAFGWLAALDARILNYSASHGELLDALRSGRVSLAPLPLHMVRTASVESGAVGHRFPAEGLPARALGVAVRSGAGSDTARVTAGRLVNAVFTGRCAAELGLLAALRTDGPQRPAADRELMARLVRPPDPESVDRWLRRFETDVRGRGAQLEQVDTILELVFGLLFAGFLFFVYLRIRRSDAREPAS